MIKRGPSSFVRDLEILYRVGTVGGQTDRELLGLFRAGETVAAQQAFEALVHRHGPMVLGVCWRVLGDEHAAEDAFQATFLVLAIKAGAIRKPDSLGPWLHGVAARISRRARVLAEHRRERPLGPPAVAVSVSTAGQTDIAELRSVLDDEADRLPARYRRAVVLCFVEGKTQEEAARELGCTRRAVAGRLARAKKLLRARLRRRGFAPSAGLIGTLLLHDSAEAGVPSAVASGAVRTAMGVLLGRAETLAGSVAVVALARGVLRAMLLGNVAATAAALLMLAVFATALAQSGARPAAPAPDHPHGQTPSDRPSKAVAAEPPVSRDLKLPEHAGVLLGTTRLRHANFVSGVAFAPDGRTLASSSWDRTVKFWDRATGEPSAQFPTLQGPDGALSLAYSPDGTKLVIGCNAGWVRLWDLAAVRERLRAKVHGGDVQSVAFAPDGRTFATSGYEDPIVRIWDAETGQERRTLTFIEKPTFQGQVAYSRDGKRLALGATSRITDGERIVIWDLDKSGDPIIIRKAHDGGLKSLIFTPDGALISCGAALKRVREPKENIIDIESKPQIRIWDAAAGRQIRELDPGVGRGHCKAVLSPNGKTLVSLHDDRLLVWDLPSGKITREIDANVDEKNFGVTVGIAISPDGTMIAAERHDYLVHLWDLATGKALYSQEK